MTNRIQIPPLKLPNNRTARLFCPDGKERDELKACLSLSHSLKSSRSSRVSVIPNGPEVAAHCLATRDMYDMTFDNNTLAWISRDPTKQSEDDPFQEISDLSVDSKEEERVLELATQQWMALGSTPDSMEKSGVWRSSRLINNGENEEWNEAPWSGSLALSSSVGSGFSRRSVDSAFEVPPRTETRTTSYGTDEMNKDVKQVEIDQDKHVPEPAENREEDEQDDDVDESVVEIPKPAIFADDGFLSSPLKNEIYIDEDGSFDGFLDHGSLRQPGRSGLNGSLASQRSASRRKSSGKTIFTGRPVSRIEEEEEASRAGQRVLHPDLEQELRRLSLNTALTPLQTPFRSSLSVPPSTKKKDVSFYLSPLPDLSYRFETTEALISLELSYITSRRGPKATPKAVEASFSIAQENLVKHLTDVEPYDPYWDFIKCLKLAGRKIETLYTLNEWCPRLAELDVSNNDLGQLTGLPDSVMNLSVRLNNLTNITFFGHLTNLQSLDVSGNGLENLDALKMCRHLREIKVDDNALTSIDGVFEIGGLMSLRCRRNKLESVDLSKCELYFTPSHTPPGKITNTGVANA
jgi:Leucine-rich repeat (LRR) protein